MGSLSTRRSWSSGRDGYVNKYFIYKVTLKTIEDYIRENAGTEDTVNNTVLLRVLFTNSTKSQRQLNQELTTLHLEDAVEGWLEDYWEWGSQVDEQQVQVHRSRKQNGPGMTLLLKNQFHASQIVNILIIPNIYRTLSICQALL